MTDAVAQSASPDADRLNASSVEYAVEWNGGEGWKRLAQTKPTEKEAREYAEWVLVKDHQMYRIIEITEKVLPNINVNDARPETQSAASSTQLVGPARELEQIDDAIQRMRKAVAECNERDYEKSQADLQRLKPKS